VRRRPLLCVTFAIGVVLGGPAGAQAGATIAPEELLDRLASASALADAGAADPSPARMHAVREAMGLPIVVRIDGHDVAVPADPVVAALVGGRAEEFGRAAERIDALRASLERAMSVEADDPAQVEAALAAAYRGVVQVDPGLFERIRRAIGELIQNLLVRLFAFRGAGTVVAWAVLVGLVLRAVGLVRRRTLVPETTMETAGGAAAPRIDWIARAEDAFRAGDLHGAAHAFYRGLLGALSGRGLLIDGPGLTAGEARTTVRALRPDLFTAVADATGAFEQIAYGGAVPDAGDIETLRKAVTLARSA
jgi:hypothetical protein